MSKEKLREVKAGKPQSAQTRRDIKKGKVIKK